MELIKSNLQLTLAEKITFLIKFLKSPCQVGSITPSSRFLAVKMLEPIDWQAVDAVAEFGAGTGAFTKYIQAVKKQNCKVAVFEKDDKMRNMLRTLCPDLNYFKDAARLSEATRSIGLDSLDAIISGLPFALFAEDMREQIIDEAIQSLKPQGIFVAFQYSLQMKPLLSRKFSQVKISFVPRNIPPAFVYVCRK
ncbi:class I SAM-dependent methyltransferase [Desulfitobacterium sp.]|uniref:class I SAM-dependent methyltransferase n=1 Tax=Desulfitobacterium sp. TaxID=49981 RepID=UPI002B1F2220|nr:methyltransferase [Desulfitobacterium sp.]MEA4902624.1 methyltransferase [Desulfitobacterium sp.]